MGGGRSDTLSTYRHLRLAMVLLLALLLVAVLLRASSAPGFCFEASISAYYFTSVRAVFVAALCAIGTCLIVYRGNRDAEDIALNASGALAFVVAFVPTKVPADADVACSASNVPGPGQLEDAVNNNVVAMVVVALAALALAAFLVRRERRAATREDREGPGKAPFVALLVFLGALVAGSAIFALWPEGFRANAHNVAAVGTFVGILAVVAINVFDSGRRGRSVRGVMGDAVGPLPPASDDLGTTRRRVLARRLYLAVALAMVVSVAVIGIAYATVAGWRHGVLWIEAALLVEFLVFWVVQTYELWNETQRAIPVDATT